MSNQRDKPGLIYGLYARRLRKGLDRTRLPHHIGMIVDGNRRWAHERALGSSAHGHRAGARKVPEFLVWCDELGIGMVTLYLLSTDNLSGRSPEELRELFDIIAALAED